MHTTCSKYDSERRYFFWEDGLLVIFTLILLDTWLLYELSTYPLASHLSVKLLPISWFDMFVIALLLNVEISLMLVSNWKHDCDKTMRCFMTMKMKKVMIYSKVVRKHPKDPDETYKMELLLKIGIKNWLTSLYIPQWFNTKISSILLVVFYWYIYIFIVYSKLIIGIELAINSNEYEQSNQLMSSTDQSVWQQRWSDKCTDYQ